MSSINKAILVGRLGVDPTIQTATTGTKYSYFTVATNSKRKNKNPAAGEPEYTESTQWHRITVFNTGIIAYLEKGFLKRGDRIYLEGRIEYKTYNLKPLASIIVDNTGLLMSLKDKNNEDGTPYSPFTSEGHRSNPIEDEIPF